VDQKRKELPKHVCAEVYSNPADRCVKKGREARKRRLDSKAVKKTKPIPCELYKMRTSPSTALRKKRVSAKEEKGGGLLQN